MKKLVILTFAALCASTAGAAELKDISAKDVQTFNIALPVPAVQKAGEAAPKCDFVSGEITKLHLLAQTGNKSLLFTYAKNEAEFKEFVEMWTPILEKFKIRVAGTEFKNGFGTLRYEAPDGLVLRDFMAEKLHYNALDPAEMKKLRHDLIEPLEQAGMEPIASFSIKHEVLRPTFNIYYLTRPEEDQARERQLRHLMNGDDIDYDLLTNAVTLVKKDASFSMVYIGRELGFKSRVSATQEGAAMKLADFKKYLAGQNKELVAARVFKLDEPFTVGQTTYNYAANIYFFQ